MYVGIASPRWQGNVPGIPVSSAARIFMYLAYGGNQRGLNWYRDECVSQCMFCGNDCRHHMTSMTWIRFCISLYDTIVLHQGLCVNAWRQWIVSGTVLLYVTRLSCVRDFAVVYVVNDVISNDCTSICMMSVSCTRDCTSVCCISDGSSWYYNTDSNSIQNIDFHKTSWMSIHVTKQNNTSMSHNIYIYIYWIEINNANRKHVTTNRFRKYNAVKSLGSQWCKYHLIWWSYIAGCKRLAPWPYNTI